MPKNNIYKIFFTNIIDNKNKLLNLLSKIDATFLQLWKLLSNHN